MWVVLAMVSALLLGCYDIFKKRSLNGNAVIPVLSLSIFVSFLFFIPLIVMSVGVEREECLVPDFYVPSVGLETHLAIAVKSVIVLLSWICAYFGMKNVPITIFSPIRATQPIWTVIVAAIIFGERLQGVQMFAVILVLVCFFFFSQVGVKEGISWKSNKWLWMIIAATLFGSASGLYDKHLMMYYDRMAVQVYSTMYQSLLMLVVLFALWFPTRDKITPFQWRWTIVGISVFLMLSDYVYFWALKEPDSMISIVSTIRRSGTVVPFAYGAIFLHEKHIKVKAILLLGVLVGVFMLYICR